jgi:hypothetical protein
MNVDRAWTGAYRAGALLSFQRRRRETPVWSPPWTLKTALEPSAPLMRGCAARRNPFRIGECIRVSLSGRREGIESQLVRQLVRMSCSPSR